MFSNLLGKTVISCNAIRLLITLAITLAITFGASASSAWTQLQGDAGHSGSVQEDTNANAFIPMWSISADDLGGGIVPGVVIDEQRAYFTARTGRSAPYEVIAVDRVAGLEQWSRGFAPYSGGLSAPAVGNNRVYVHQWGHSGISGGSAAQYPYVSGIDAATGDLDFATSHSGQWSSGSRPTVIGEDVYAAGGYYGGLDAYDGVTGSKGWFARVNQQYGWVPAADSDHVYVYMGAASASPGPPVGRLYAFNRSSGGNAFTIINSDDTWTRNNASPVVGTSNNVLAFSRTREGQKIVSFDLANRSVEWRITGSLNGNVAVDDGLLYAPNGIELSVYDETTGDKLDEWFAPPGESLVGNILVTDDLAFAQTSRGTYAIDRSTLATVWSTDARGDLAYGGGQLFISNSSAVRAYQAIPEPSSVALVLSLAIGIGAAQPGRGR